MKVTIDRLDHFGRGITTIDNKICFIENALPGEIVNIEITKEKKKYLEGQVIKYINKSKNRVKELCPYSNICGGCNLNHMKYENENEFKVEKIKDLISKFSNLDKNLVKDIVYSNEYNYRNKAVFHIKNKKLGYYKKNTNEIVEIDNCLLLDNKINEVIPTLKKIAKENNIEQIEVKVSNDSKKLLISTDKNKNIITNISNYKYMLSPDTFFQVNKYVTELLYNEILKNIKKYKSKNVLDLYCGSGTIGIYISKYVAKVLGVEINKQSIIDANKNKKLNKVNNIKFIEGKVSDIIKDIKDKYDTIIIDPPRSGLDKDTINSILKINPKTIIYVSCDPTTLSRDLNILKDKYNVKYIKPFNMFPKTYHCESIAVLERK